MTIREYYDFLTGLSPLELVLVVCGFLFIFLVWYGAYRLFSRSLRQQTEGLRQGAGVRGDMRVARPVRRWGLIVFGLLFCGGGAAFYALVVLRQQPEGRDWAVFGGLLLGAVLIVVVLARQFREIRFGKEGMHLHWFGHRATFPLHEIDRIEPLATDVRRGGRIIMKDGRKLRVQADYIGYKDLLLFLHLNGVPVPLPKFQNAPRVGGR